MKRNVILVPAVSLILAGGAAFSAQALSSNHSPNRQDDRRPTYSQPVREQPLPGYIKTFCDHGNRLYVNRQTGDIGVAAQDPTCGRAATLPEPTRTTSAPTQTTSTPTRTTPTWTQTTRPSDPRGGGNNDPRGGGNNDPRGGGNNPHGGGNNDPRPTRTLSTVAPR